jgi:basic amino acid/polyamine antiporter, APA family
MAFGVGAIVGTGIYTLVGVGATAAGLMILRVREPNLVRPFRAPLAFIIAPAAILGCAYLFYSLPVGTQIRFFVWMGIGAVVYFVYSRNASNMSKVEVLCRAEKALIGGV